MWQYIRLKAFDECPGNPDCDPSYVLWWHRHGPFKRAVLRQVVELVHYFGQGYGSLVSDDQHKALDEQRRPSIDASISAGGGEPGNTTLEATIPGPHPPST